MRISKVCYKVDKKFLVQRRLPWRARKILFEDMIEQQRLRMGIDMEEPAPSKAASIVVQIQQATKRRERNLQTWSNLLDQALLQHTELTPEDMASVMWSMAEARFRHDQLLREFVRSISFRTNVKALVTAMLALDRLGLPTESLRRPFLQQVSGQCEGLSFGDLRRILMALARVWKTSPIQSNLLEELCNATVAKAEDCDPRDLVAVPQHLGRIRFPHPELLAASTTAISVLISSRLSVLPLDVLRSFDGLLLLVPVVKAEEAKEFLVELAEKCRLLSSQLLRDSSAGELWKTGGQLFGAEVSQQPVWAVWASEAVERRLPGVSPGNGASQVRKRVMRSWGSVPEGLEVALRVLIRKPDPT